MRTDYGIIRFQSLEYFADPFRGLNHESRIHQLLDVLDSGELKDSLADWTPIKRALRRNSLFVVESESPAWNALLRFDPEDLSMGDYQISRSGRAQPDSGRIEAVTKIASDSKNFRMRRIAQCPEAFQVVTYSNHRGHRNIWLVGINLYEQFDLSAEDENA